MALVTTIPVPLEAETTVRKVVLTDRYLVAATVSGWMTVLDVHALEESNGIDASHFQKTFQADRLWDLDCRDDTIATANENGTVTLWDAKIGTRQATLSGHLNLVKHILLPTCQQIAISGSRDTSIMIWNTLTHQRRAVLTGHRERITMLQVFDMILVSASADGGLRMWDLMTDSCIGVFKRHEDLMLMPRILACGMSEDRKLLATGDVQGEVRIWRVDDCTYVATCHGHTKITTQFSNAQGNVLVSASVDGSIRSWDWTTGNPIRTLDGHNGMCVRGFVFTEKYMISGGMDGGVHVWDRQTWDFKCDLSERLGHVNHLVKRGKLLAVAVLLHSGSSVVELWDLTALEKKVEEGVSI